MWNNIASETSNNRNDPPRKRRRPALSCFECRRRKIKCDRNQPCNQCVQSRVPRCSYDAESTPPNLASGQWSETPVASFSATNTQRRAPHPLLPQFPTPASSPRTGSNTENPILLPRPPQNHPNYGEPRDTQSFRRPAQLETPTSQPTIQKPLTGIETFAAQNKSPELQGVLSKNRLYGPSHYVSEFSSLSTLPLNVAALSKFTVHVAWAISCSTDNHQILIS